MTVQPATWAPSDLFEMVRLKPAMTPEEIGEANVDQMTADQIRVFAIRSLLLSTATGTVETAARHRAAIRMIEDTGVARLADLAVAA